MIGPEEHHEWIDLLVDVGGNLDDGLSLRLTGADAEVVAGPGEFAVPAAEIADLMASLQPTIKRSSRSEVTDPARAAGSRLFEALFGGPRARFYPRVREAARRMDAGVCVRLQLADPRLRELPWELLYDSTATRSDFLALDPSVCVVRSVPPPQPRPLHMPPAPLRVVVDGGEEGREHADVDLLTSLRSDADLVLVIASAATPRQHDVMSEPGDVWHIGRDRSLRWPLDDHRPLVITSLAPTSTRAAERMAVTVPAVVASSPAVPERAENAFVEAFYRALFAGTAIQDAISAGRREADYAQPGGRHWASVICYLTGGGPVVDLGGPAGELAIEPTAATSERDVDYDDLRSMIAHRNLTALREQAARLGDAAPVTLQRQIAELEQPTVDRPRAT